MEFAAETRVRHADAGAIGEAASILRRGGLVAFPTETVYGLGADAMDGKAVAAIFAAKGRPRFNPLIVHVQNQDAAEKLAEMPLAARKLADRFWPGALTLVLSRTQNCAISLLASAGLDTIALRVPSHPVARELLERANIPVAAPSANLSGRITATTAGHVASELGKAVSLILDAGPTPLGIESTIIGFSGERAVLLRPGAVPRDAIETVVGPLLAPADGTIQAPGQLESHYAPQAILRLNAHAIQHGEALLAFGPDITGGAVAFENLSPTGDMAEAAANLFAMLRALDQPDVRVIAVAPIPEHGLGEAINDRLRRAAAPRSSVP